MNPVVAGVVVAYCVVLAALGIWARKDTRSVRGFYLAKKRLPSWVVAFSSNATGESAWLLLGLTGMGYLVGFHAFWVVAGEVLGVALAWGFVAKRFKEQSDRYDAVTASDYLSARLGDRWLIRVIGAVIILSMAATYTAAQLVASGKAFSSFLGTTHMTGVLVGAGIVLVYTTVGGFKAVAYSDFAQGLMMLLCLLALPIIGIAQAGGWTAMTSSLSEIDPSLLSLMGSSGFTAQGIASVLSYLGIGLAFLGAPQLLTRFMSARDTGEIRKAGPLAVSCIIVFDVGAVLTGIAGRTLFPMLPDQETILPTMSGAYLPSVFQGLVLVVVLAAIMSTVDSLLLLASSAVAWDLVRQAFRRAVPDKAISALGKGVTLVIGGIALAFAIGEPEMLFWFILFAWSGLASGFAPAVLCALFWKGTTRIGAASGMAAGFLTAIIWVEALKERVLDLYEMIPGFFAGFLVTVLVSVCTKRRIQESA